MFGFEFFIANEIPIGLKNIWNLFVINAISQPSK